MNKTSLDLSAAIDAATRARREALQSKRSAGEPRNPARARPGMERQFEDAGRDAKAFDFILKLLEKEEKTERALAAFPRKQKTAEIADRALDFFIGFGLISLASLGVAAALVLLRSDDRIIRGVAVVNAALALIRAIKSSRK